MRAGKCKDLDTLTLATGVIVNGYKAPSLEGLNLSFSCPPGQELNGPNTTTCMENGEWELDPTNLKCEGIWRECECGWSHIASCNLPISSADVDSLHT